MASQGEACRNCATAEVLKERLSELEDALGEASLYLHAVLNLLEELEANTLSSKQRTRRYRERCQRVLALIDLLGKDPQWRMHWRMELADLRKDD